MSTLSQKEEYTVPSAYHHIQDVGGVLCGECVVQFRLRSCFGVTRGGVG